MPTRTSANSHIEIFVITCATGPRRRKVIIRSHALCYTIGPHFPLVFEQYGNKVKKSKFWPICVHHVHLCVFTALCLRERVRTGTYLRLLHLPRQEPTQPFYPARAHKDVNWRAACKRSG